MERHDPSAHRQPIGLSCVLQHGRPTRREVADGTIAEPSAARRDIPMLRYAKLASGGLNEVLKELQGGRDLLAGDDAPTVVSQLVRLGAAQSHKKVLLRPCR